MHITDKSIIASKFNEILANVGQTLASKMHPLHVNATSYYYIRTVTHLPGMNGH